MRFGFVPSDLLRSCASFIAFSFRRPVSRGTPTFQFVRPAEFLLAETTPKQQREEFPLGSQAIGLCSAQGAEAAESRNTNFPFVRLQSGKNRRIAHILLRVFASKNRAGLLGQNEPREEE